MSRTSVLDEIARKISDCAGEQPLQVAIDGIDAAGKTTLADELADCLRAGGYGVIRASIDDFHQPQAVRARQGKLSPQGYYDDSFNYEALKMLLLEPLSPQGSRRYKTAAFDFRTDAAVDALEQIADDGAILLLDGIFLQRPELAGCLDIKILVQIPFELALTRAIERVLSLFGTREMVEARYQQRYLPGQRLYFAQCHPEANADMIIDNRDPAQPEITVCRI